MIFCIISHFCLCSVASVHFCYTVPCIMCVSGYLSAAIRQFYQIVIQVVFITYLCSVRIYDCLQVICFIIDVTYLFFRTTGYFGDSSKCIVFVTAGSCLILHGYPFPCAVICVGHRLFCCLSFSIFIGFFQQVIQFVVIIGNFLPTRLRVSGQSSFFIVIELFCSSCRIFDGCEVAFQIVSIIRCLIFCIGEGYQLVHVVVAICGHSAKRIRYFCQIIILIVFQTTL